MPAIFQSYTPEPGDDLATRMKRLYLGMVSLGEDLYTFNAAINEMRKQHEVLDKRHKEIESEYKVIKHLYQESQKP